MKDLAMAARTPYDHKNIPCTTQILGHCPEEFSSALASKLVKRLNKPVYVSFNVTIGAPFDSWMQLIEHKIFEEIHIHPQWFL